MTSRLLIIDSDAILVSDEQGQPRVSNDTVLLFRQLLVLFRNGRHPVHLKVALLEPSENQYDSGDVIEQLNLFISALSRPYQNQKVPFEMQVKHPSQVTSVVPNETYPSESIFIITNNPCLTSFAKINGVSCYTTEEEFTLENLNTKAAMKADRFVAFLDLDNTLLLIDESKRQGRTVLNKHLIAKMKALKAQYKECHFKVMTARMNTYTMAQEGMLVDENDKTIKWHLIKIQLCFNQYIQSNDLSSRSKRFFIEADGHLKQCKPSSPKLKQYLSRTQNRIDYILSDESLFNIIDEIEALGFKLIVDASCFTNGKEKHTPLMRSVIDDAKAMPERICKESDCAIRDDTIYGFFDDNSAYYIPAARQLQGLWTDRFFVHKCRHRDRLSKLLGSQLLAWANADNSSEASQIICPRATRPFIN